LRKGGSRKAEGEPVRTGSDSTFRLPPSAFLPGRLWVAGPRENGFPAQQEGWLRLQGAWVDFIPAGVWDPYPQAGGYSRPDPDVHAVTFPAARVWRIEWVGQEEPGEYEDPFAEREGGEGGQS